jgi:hypothetical protein
MRRRTRWTLGTVGLAVLACSGGDQSSANDTTAAAPGGTGATTGAATCGAVAAGWAAGAGAVWAGAVCACARPESMVLARSIAVARTPK